MVVKMTHEKYDPNSTEYRNLVLRGVDVGKYSFGLYSKWYLQYQKSTGEVIPLLENFVCGLIHKKENIDMLNASDIHKCQEYIKKRYNQTIVEWFEEFLENDYRRY